MSLEHHNKSVHDWETHLGEQVRAARIAAGLDQATVAELADLSVGAVKNLEGGKGSSLKTLIRVLRVLDRTDWLDALAPPITISPLQMLAAKRAGPGARRRVSSRRAGPRPMTHGR
jgi:transcriptional regulator with XRE-family HTH domain